MPRMIATPREILRFPRQGCEWPPARHGILQVTCECELKHWMPKHSNKKVASCLGRAQSWWWPSQVWEARVECKWHKVVTQKCSEIQVLQREFCCQLNCWLVQSQQKCILKTWVKIIEITNELFRIRTRSNFGINSVSDFVSGSDTESDPESNSTISFYEFVHLCFLHFVFGFF